MEWLKKVEVAAILKMRPRSVPNMARSRGIRSEVRKAVDSLGHLRPMRFYNREDVMAVKAAGYDPKVEKSKRARVYKEEGHPYARYDATGARPQLTEDEHKRAMALAMIRIANGKRVEDDTRDFDPAWVKAWDDQHGPD